MEITRWENRKPEDHVAISRRWKRNLQDTRAMSSADIGSDHHLLLTKVRLKSAVQKKQKRDRVKYVEKLRNEDVRNQFQLTLANKYDVLYKGSDMEEGEDSVDKRMEKHQKYVPVNM